MEFAYHEDKCPLFKKNILARMDSVFLIPPIT